MEIGVLGALQVRSDDGADIHVGPPKLRALLVTLALEVGRVLPVDLLVDHVWGDAPPGRAVVSLRSYVSNLRRLLATPANPTPVAMRGPGYVLDLPPASVDAIRFEHLVREGRTLVPDDPERALERLDEALALWRGPALLDVADLAFAQAPAARLEELRATAVEERFDALLTLGRHADVVAEAEAHVRTLPLRERPREQLMLALHRSGRTADALAVHRDLRTTLGDELGLDPGAGVEGLVEAILRRDTALDWRPADVRRGLEGPPGTAPAGRGTPHGTGEDELVGRQQEQDRLRAAVDVLDSGRGGPVVLAGEPGIGKTALLEWLAAEAASRGHLVVTGRCLEGAPALWPWVQALRAATAVLDDERLGHATRGAGAAVGHLLPEVAERTGRPANLGALDPVAARFALQDGVATFLARISDATGLVVLLDDLHWTDAASAELLGFVVTHVRGSRVLLVGTHRDTRADQTPALEAALAALARADATTIRLGGLSRAAVGQLAGKLAHLPVDDHDVALLEQRSGGNPFLVRQLAQLARDTDDPAIVPAGARQVLRQRLARLAPEVRDSLSVASVLGVDITPRLVADVRRLPVGDVRDHLDVARDHGLVEATDGHLRFVHALVRETLAAELAPSRAAALHAAAATALEGLADPPVQAIAEHLWLAADVVSADRPVRWLRAAADAAMSVFALDQAVGHLERALELLAHHPDPAVELEVRVRLVQVLVGLDGWTADRIPAIVERARSLARESGSAPGLTSLMWSRWALAMTRGDVADARTRAAQLLADTQDGLPAERVAGQVASAYAAVFRVGPGDEVDAALRAAAEAEALAAPHTLGLVPERLDVARRVTEALAAAFAGDASAARAWASDAIEAAAVAGTPFAEAYARMFGGFIAAILGRPDDALAWTTPGLVLCESHGLTHVANLTVPTHAWASAHAGAPLPHARRLALAVDDLRRSGHHHALAQWLLLLADVQAMVGDVDAAHRALAESRETAVAVGEVVYGAQWDRVAAQMT